MARRRGTLEVTNAEQLEIAADGLPVRLGRPSRPRSAADRGRSGRRGVEQADSSPGARRDRCCGCPWPSARGGVAGWSAGSRSAAHRGPSTRTPSTVSREVRSNGGRERYRAHRGERRRDRLARRPRTPKLARERRLRAQVEAWLERRWSPRRTGGDTPAHVSRVAGDVGEPRDHLSLAVRPGSGALRRELARHLRTGRTMRQPRGQRHPGGQIRDMVPLRERPAEVEDRAVPGRWEGDLLIGYNNQSAIGTLVERRTRVRHAGRPAWRAWTAPYVRERLDRAES